MSRERTLPRLLWPLLIGAGLLGFVGVATLAATWDATTDIDRMVSSGSIVFLYVPVLAWTFAEGGTRRACTRHHGAALRRWSCLGDHGIERRLSWAVAAMTLVPVLVLLVQRAWEGAALVSLFPVGFAVLASSFRTRPAWDAEIARRRPERRVRH